MTINSHVEELAGFPVQDYLPDTPLENPAGSAFRLSSCWRDPDNYEGDTPLPEVLTSFVEEQGAAEVPALVIGAWIYDEMLETGPGSIVEALVAVRDRLPKLKAIFLGDIIYEQCEISWIRQGDVSPLFTAYPQLEYFRVRGGNNLTIGTLNHDHLRTLIIEAGGLPVEVVRDLAASNLPQLEHLELWLGTPEYGGNTSVEDLGPLLEGTRFPKLSYLGLRDSAIADQVALVVSISPLLRRIRVLDLSLGTLGDEGAEALLNSPVVAKLEKLDLHYHFISPGMRQKLEQLGITLDISDPQDESQWGRYCAVSE